MSSIFICYGKRKDPWQIVLKELVQLWLRLVPGHFRQWPNDLRIAWSRAKRDVYYDGKVHWHKVTGILSNMIASLYTIGWEPRTFSEWVQPNGDVWSLPLLPETIFSPAHLVYAIQDDVSAHLWKQASTHMQGEGLENGIAHGYTMALLHQYRKQKIHDRAAALETILVGACWSPHRRCEANMIPVAEDVCSFCGFSPCDDYHQFWGCPHLAGSEWPEIANSQVASWGKWASYPELIRVAVGFSPS